MTLERPYRISFLITLLLTATQVTAQKSKSSFVCKDQTASYKTEWTLIDNVKALQLKPVNGNTKLPKKYKVFTVTTTHLSQYLTGLRTKGGTLQLPVPDEAAQGGLNCITFQVENSGTMSRELNDRYPQLVSLKGYAVSDQSNTIRYDYDGTSQKIAVIWNGVNYLYTPYKSNNKIYYLLFNKADDNNAVKRTGF